MKVAFFALIATLLAIGARDFRQGALDLQRKFSGANWPAPELIARVALGIGSPVWTTFANWLIRNFA